MILLRRLARLCLLRLPPSSSKSWIPKTTPRTAMSSSSSSNEEPVLKSWRELVQISSDATRNTRGSNYVQLATVDSQSNTPKCRTVVFRGFQDLSPGHALANQCNNLSCILRMTTHGRSPKVQQATQQANAELVWWFPATSEQYRVSGQLVFVGGAGTLDHDDDDGELQTARQAQWSNMSDAARESFFSPAAPGTPYSSPDSTVVVPAGGKDGTGQLLPPPDDFLLMLLSPDSADYLNLKSNFRQGSVRQGDGTWVTQRLNP